MQKQLLKTDARRDIRGEKKIKKITLVAMALLCSVAFTDCAAKKPVKQTPKTDPQQAMIDSLRKEAEIRRLKAEIEAQEEDAKLERDAKRAEKVADMEIAKLRAANAKKAISKRMGQDLFTPCIEDSYDKPGEYMAGLGIVENEDERGLAAVKANHNAIENIASRYIGAIKNGMSLYYKDVTPRSRDKAKENENEGNVEAVGMKVIEKYANTVCGPIFEQDDMGGYTCYVAIHVPLKNVVNETIDELGIIQTDADRQRFRDYMNQELEKQAQAASAEKAELEKMREELK